MISNMFPRSFRFLALLFIVTAAAQAQPAAQPLNLVMPTGPGRIALPSIPDFVPESVTAYDDGQRPVVQFNNKKTNVTVSYILFHNLSGKPTAQGCSDDVMGPLLQKFGAGVSKLTRSPAVSNADSSSVTASYFINSIADVRIQQKNVFGFFGDAKTCAEIHISKVAYVAADEPLLASVLAIFQADLTYTPVAKDYIRFATILDKNAPEAAAPYYSSALSAIPVNPGTLQARRFTTNLLAVALGRSGKIQQSRALLESAIANDPNYPTNYYNLACADAEQGNGAAAKLHLQLAYDHRDGLMQGEPFPDPLKDDSFLKLKKDKAFWDYVQSISTTK
jgi:hypothetical protein